MKNKLRDAAKQLLWEVGYASMSPRQILDRSGAGQGSFYHHYRGKSDLAADALLEIEREMVERTSLLFDETKPPLDRIRDYLRLERDGLKGCRLGRLANETEVLDVPELRAPIAQYFRAAQQYVAQALDDAKRCGQISTTVKAEDVAAAIVASVQGGYLLSRAEADPNQIRRATHGALTLLDALQLPTSP